MIAPHYISEHKSDMRGIKAGWYAIEGDGNIFSGPFASREECVERLAQPTDGTTASELLLPTSLRCRGRPDRMPQTASTLKDQVS